MALTKGEIVQVAGRLVENIGVKLDDPETPDTITKAELFDMVKDFLEDALSEFVD